MKRFCFFIVCIIVFSQTFAQKGSVQIVQDTFWCEYSHMRLIYSGDVNEEPRLIKQSNTAMITIDDYKKGVYYFLPPYSFQRKGLPFLWRHEMDFQKNLKEKLATIINTSPELDYLDPSLRSLREKYIKTIYTSHNKDYTYLKFAIKMKVVYLGKIKTWEIPKLTATQIGKDLTPQTCCIRGKIPVYWIVDIIEVSAF